MTGKEYQQLAMRTCSIPYDQKDDEFNIRRHKILEDIE